MPQTISIEPAEVAAGLNQFVTKYGTKLNETLRQGLEFETELPMIDLGEADAYTGQDIEITGGLQPYQYTFTPVNGESYDGIDNFIEIGKDDRLFTAEQLEKFRKKWRPGWFSPDPNDIWNMYASYILRNHVINKIMEDLNSVSYNGIRVVPTPGTAGAVLESYDGYKKRIADQITAGRLTPIVTGALLASTMVAQVRDYCAQVPEPHRYKSGKIYISKTLAQAYSDDYLDKFPRRDPAVSMADKLYLTVDNYNKTVVGVTAMEGSDRMILVFDNMESMQIFYKGNQYPVYRFQHFDRTVKCYMELYRNFGFESCKNMFVNDQV